MPSITFIKGYIHDTVKNLFDVLREANCKKYKLPVKPKTLLDVLREVNDCAKV